MDASLKAKWVEALRSGEYHQAAGKLHDEQEGSFCCLGVLCKVMGAEFGPATVEESDSHYDNVPVLNGRILSAGNDDELDASFCKEIGISNQRHLINLNDGYYGGEDCEIDRHSFAQIADYIEKHL